MYFYNHHRKIQGITLIELMIAVAIVGILAAIVYPSYRAQILKSRRVDVQRVMVEYAQSLERYYTINATYMASKQDATKKLCAVPLLATTSGYTLAASCENATTFTITATPDAAAQKAGEVNQTLDQAGARTGKWSS